RSTVMPGVRIGHGAIIASGSVVVDDVPDYGIAGGNPARLIRRRHGDADIDRLLALAWWDWPLEHITRHIRTIMSGTDDDLPAHLATAIPVGVEEPLRWMRRHNATAAHPMRFAGLES
ncbi:hypothetical protein ABZ913_16000, partial [Streptosporangium sandarakinum]